MNDMIYFTVFVLVAINHPTITNAFLSNSNVGWRLSQRISFTIIRQSTARTADTVVERSQPRFHPTFQNDPVGVDEALSTSSTSSDAERALSSLSATLLALLVGDEEAAESLAQDRHHKQSLIRDAFKAYDVCDSGTLSQSEARQLFIDLARNIVTDIATPSDDREKQQQNSTGMTDESKNRVWIDKAKESGASRNDGRQTANDENVNSQDRGHINLSLASFRPSSNKTVVPKAARAHAQRVLARDEATTTSALDPTRDHDNYNKSNSNTIERIASKLLLMADTDMDGRVSLIELADLFETIYGATAVTTKNKNDDSDKSSSNNNNTDSGTAINTFPQPLRALAGSLHLVPASEGVDGSEAALPPDAKWNVGVPGDDHTLRRVTIEDGQLSIVGIGRSADASSYFLPELGIVLDAGLNVKSLRPRTVLLTHGHRDHISALPIHAASHAKIFCPKQIQPLVRRFLLAEAQLNYGDVSQSDEETVTALGEYDLNGMIDGDEVVLPRDFYQGSPTPIGIQVFTAPHKEGVPAVSYGLFRVKKRLKAEYANLPKSEIGSLIRQDKNIQLTEPYHEGFLFYTGDTTIRLLRDRWEEILTNYKHVIHEVTFLGRPSSELDETTAAKGHTHYAQLHPWICAFPDTTFILVHWSLRYSRDDILQFFKEDYGGVPKNVVLWI